MSSSLPRHLGRRAERVRGSAQFVDGRFRNTARVGPGLKPGTTLSTMGKFFFGGERRVPKAPLPSVDPRPLWSRRSDGGLRATWLGHSTVLIEIDGFRVLTDPVWGERASPSSLVGPRRFQPVPLALDELPPLDAVVLSHDHYDHLCEATVRRLARTRVPFYTSLGVGARLEAFGVAPECVVELDWWESAEIGRGGLTITAAPSQHFSGRGLGDRNTTLWSSFAVRGAHHAIFFSGDTGLTPEYGEIRTRLGPFDLVLLEVGAFHPSWGDIHLGPENALRALELLGGGALLPIHWGTFNLAIHDWDEPAETLLRLAGGTRLVMPILGVPTEPGKVEAVEPWWRTISRLERRPVVEVEAPAQVSLEDPLD